LATVKPGLWSDWLEMTGQRIDLYYGLLDAVDRPQAYVACLAMLSRDEKRRAERFVFERHRRQFVFAHGLLRVALSRFAPGVDPSDWCFAANEYGRPFVSAPETARVVHFSLSHTEGCVACVVSGCESVGVDVEEIRERQSLLATACRHFSAEEIDALRALEPQDMVDRFFDYWTLKEAYLKARGTGATLPLDRFSIIISSDQGIRIRFAPGMANDAERWRFKKLSPSAQHRLALADGSGLNGGLPIVVQPWPLP
jgi:4'-phosphopantetheinyl transferase